MTSERRFGHVSQSGPPLSLPPSIPFLCERFCASPSPSSTDHSFFRPAVPLATYSPLTQYNTLSALPPSSPPLVLAFGPSSPTERERGGSSMLGRSRSVGRSALLFVRPSRPPPSFFPSSIHTCDTEAASSLSISLVRTKDSQKGSFQLNGRILASLVPNPCACTLLRTRPALRHM